MTYQLLAACCGTSTNPTDIQDRIDLERWEGEGGAPARHRYRASSCTRSPREEAVSNASAKAHSPDALVTDVI